MSPQPPAQRRLVVRGTRRWTSDDDLWERHTVEQQLAALPTLRTAAERWAAGVTTLLGGASLGALLTGADTFADLAGGAETAGKLLFLAAGLAASVAAGSALLASGATTRRLFLAAGPAYRAAQEAAVRDAARKLAVSRWAAALGVVLLLAATAVLFFGDRDPADADAFREVRLCEPVPATPAQPQLALCLAGR